jgi:transcriptional regulator with XRE-family HTH domain
MDIWSLVVKLVLLVLVLMPKQEPKEQIYRLIGKRIAEAREAKGFSQLALANLLKGKGIEIQRTSITHIEKGVQRVMLHSLYPIAEALGVEVANLLPPQLQLKDSGVEIVKDTPGGDWVIEVMNKKIRK